MIWQTVRLSEVCDLQNGHAFKSNDYVEYSSTLNCRMSNIRPDGSFDLSHNPKFLPDEYANIYEKYLLQDDDVVIAMTDMANEPKILGVPTIVNKMGKNLLLNQRVGKLIIKDRNKLYVPYLKYVLNQEKVRHYYKKFAGGGLQINLGKKDLLSVAFPLPPLPEQKRIASILDKADALREKRKKAIAKLDELLQSVFLDMFGDPTTNSKNWGKVHFEESCTFLTGFAFKSSKFVKAGEGVRLCRGANVLPKRVDWKDSVDWPFDQADNYLRYKLKTGDIIVAMDRPWISSGFKIAQISINDPECFLVQRVARIQSVKPFTNNYLFYLLTSEAFKRNCKMTETTVPHISPKDFRSFRVMKPDKQLLHKFDRIIEKSNVFKSNLKNNLAKINNLFHALQQRAFKGEL